MLRTDHYLLLKNVCLAIFESYSQDRNFSTIQSLKFEPINLNLFFNLRFLHDSTHWSVVHPNRHYYTFQHCDSFKPTLRNICRFSALPYQKSFTDYIRIRVFSFKAVAVVDSSRAKQGCMQGQEWDGTRPQAEFGEEKPLLIDNVCNIFVQGNFGVPSTK